MDTNQLRGKLLAKWVAEHGGAAACLAATPLIKGEAALRSRESYLSQSIKDGFGERAARGWENLFEPIGLPEGMLTRPDASVLDRKTGLADPSSSDLNAPHQGATRSPVVIQRDTTSFKFAPTLDLTRWEESAVSVDEKYPGDGYNALAIHTPLPPTVVQALVEMDSIDVLKVGDQVALDTRADPWPGDVVFCRLKEARERVFPCYYLPSLDGRSFEVEVQRPRVRTLPKDEVDLLGVVVAHYAARRFGSRPGLRG